MYDIAIIGAGINGSCVAYEFGQAGKSVAIFDTDAIAGGGSGAAGAFISPKFSKAGELKKLINDAFIYSMQFYEQKLPQHFKKSSLIHLAKDEQDGETLEYYKKHTDLELENPTKESLEKLNPDALEFGYVSMQTGVVDAQKMCEALCAKAKFFREEVTSLVYDEDMWIINETYSAREVVLATGAYKQLLPEPYIQLRGVWGHRIDVKTSTKNENTLHQYVSISTSDKEGVLAIGATHDVHYHPQSAKEPYDIEAGRAELLAKAAKTIKLEKIEVLKDYTGLRSGSFDYLPLLGRIVLSGETLACCEKQIRVKHPDFNQFLYYPNLYMINGNGGYGFVLAPYLAKMLREYVLEAKKIDERLSPARFFARWVKRK